MGSRLFAVPQTLSKKVVIAGMLSTVGLTGFYAYQRAFGLNPPRYAKDEEGVWRWMTRKEAFEARLKEAQKRLEEEPDSEDRKREVQMRAYLLGKELLALKEAGRDQSGKKPISEEDLTLK